MTNDLLCVRRKNNRCRRRHAMMCCITMAIVTCAFLAVVLVPTYAAIPRLQPDTYWDAQTLDLDDTQGDAAAVHMQHVGVGRSALRTDNAFDTNLYVDNNEGPVHHVQTKTFPDVDIGRRVDVVNNRTKTKRLPQAIIIGVKKAGTRALLEYLRLHPDIKAPGPEPHFFDKNYNKGLNWYRDLMPETYRGQLTMEKTPSYFVTKGIPERVYRMSKKTKLIVVFRDPVTRAISDYAQLASRNPHVKSFEEMAFVDNITRHVSTSWTIVKIGIYAQHLARWLDYFPLRQIHFLSGESLIDNPAMEMKRLQEFLGLQQYITADNFTFNHTKGFPCYKRERLKGSWHCLNDEKGRQHPDVTSAAITRLQEFYRPFNNKLYSMIGRDFNWL